MTVSKLSSTATHAHKQVGKQSYGLSLVALFVYVGAALLLVNQRVGWDDAGGPNILAAVLRSDVWFGLAIIASFVYLPQWLPRNRVAKQVLFSAPITFLVLTGIASVMNGIFHGQFIDYLGASEVGRMLISFWVGLIVFSLARSQDGFAPKLVQILIWAPMANIIVGLSVIGLGINTIPGFNDNELNGEGFVGLGLRFQGLGSNANIVSVQSSIAIALLLPKLLYAKFPLWKKAGFAAYLLGLCSIMVWTGVRAGLVVLPVIFLLLVWVLFSPTITGMFRILGMLVFAGGFVGLVSVVADSLGALEMLTERLGTEDGRLFLWQHYAGLLLQNPFGFGMGFESIVDTALVVKDQRLPPHNTLIQAGMYAGFAGVGVSLFIIGRMLIVLASIRRAMQFVPVSPELIGLGLAWASLVTSVMFGGLLNGDFNFTILTGLLFAGVSMLPPRHRIDPS